MSSMDGFRVNCPYNTSRQLISTGITGRRLRGPNAGRRGKRTYHLYLNVGYESPRSVQCNKLKRFNLIYTETREGTIP